jgi:hypothetical protein
MKKILISEELVDVSTLTLNNIDTTAIKNVKTDNGLLTDINNAAKNRNQIVTIGSSNGNTVSITKFSDSVNPNIEVSKLVEDVNPNSDYNRVKYFTDDLKKNGYVLNSTGGKVITWGNGKMTISKTEKTQSVSLSGTSTPSIDTDTTEAETLLKQMISPEVSKFNILNPMKKTKTESLVKEEINRIKQLMK